MLKGEVPLSPFMDSEWWPNFLSAGSKHTVYSGLYMIKELIWTSVTDEFGELLRDTHGFHLWGCILALQGNSKNSNWVNLCVTSAVHDDARLLGWLKGPLKW